MMQLNNTAHYKKHQTAVNGGIVVGRIDAIKTVKDSRLLRRVVGVAVVLN